MAKSELTGIERELVLKYLMDGNVPVTVTPVTETAETVSDSRVPEAASAVFPIAIRPDTMKVLEQGIILLNNPPQSVSNFDGRKVKVEFYFNRLGLCFITKMKKVSTGLALVIPASIDRVSELPAPRSKSFAAVMYYSCGNKKDVHIDCVPAPGYELFSKPVWSSIEQDCAVSAKKYLEQFVGEAKKHKDAGNGIYLIPVCRYITEKAPPVKPVQGRAEPLAVLYVNHECIVFGCENANIPVEDGIEYALMLSFPIEGSAAVSKRDVFVTCFVKRIYSTPDTIRRGIVCTFTSMKEEDKRFVYEMTTKNLFV